MTPNLLPCPFCGEPASHGNGFSPCESIVYAWCSNNDCQLHLIDHYGFTPETWNTRAKAAPTEPQSDAVIVPRELLEHWKLSYHLGRISQSAAIREMNAALLGGEA